MTDPDATNVQPHDSPDGWELAYPDETTYESACEQGAHFRRRIEHRDGRSGRIVFEQAFLSAAVVRKYGRIPSSKEVQDEVLWARQRERFANR